MRARRVLEKRISIARTELARNVREADAIRDALGVAERWVAAWERRVARLVNKLAELESEER